MKTRKLVLIVGIGMLVTIVAVASKRRTNPATAATAKQAKQKSTPEAEGKMSAFDMQAVYYGNTISADQTYKGKRWQVYGLARSVQKDILGRPFVILESATDLPLNTVNCYFKKGQTDDAARIRPQTYVLIEGTCKGKLLGAVVFEDCSFVRTIDQNELTSH